MRDRRTRVFYSLLIACALLLIAGTTVLAPTASAQNDQEGNNSSEVDQDGDADVGDAIGGQSISVTGGARTRIDATNSSDNVRARTGDATAENSATSQTGQQSDSDDEEASNEQDGDNDLDLDQSADATTGDAVGGQVIGVTSRGDTSITATNSSNDVDLVTGDAEATNNADVLVGLVATTNAEGTQINLCGNNIFSGPFFDFDLCVNFDEAEAENDQDGDNSADVSQSADATSGDGVGGQVISVTSMGDTTIDATNSSEDVDIDTGDAESTNNAFVVAGLTAAASNEGIQANICGNNIFSDPFINIAICANIAAANPENTQDGDNSADVSQGADATTGDGVGGQVVGVTSTGDSRITASNTSKDVDVSTGDAESTNNAEVIVGLLGVATNEGLQLNLCGNNIASDPDFNLAVCINAAIANPENDQTGDNSADVSQSADASSGDGVGGQVIGVASRGNSTIDATNRSEDVDVSTGDADSSNNADVLVGLFGIASNEGTQVNVCGNNIGSDPGINIAICANLAVADPENTQDGDNSADVGQSADASTGDGVGGQVIGVRSNGDSDVTAANTSEDVDVDTGDADASNNADVDVGLVGVSGNDVAQINVCGNNLGSEPDFNFALCANIAAVSGNNDQTGDNSSDVSQSARASTGDGVGGQVIGVVSAGDTSVEATNRSEDVTVDTGDADTDNTAEIDVGLFGLSENDAGLQINLCDGICINATPPSFASNVQDGDNSSDLSQRTSSSSGDGVAGQVVGVTAPDGGDADLVLSNQSQNIDVDSGDDDENNSADTFVGLAIGPLEL